MSHTVMKARWVLHDPSPKMPTVARTIVAKWWPGRYYLVSTVGGDSSSPLCQLTESIGQSFPRADATPGPARYVTHVFRCNEDGWVHSFLEPLYEKEYSELAAAHEGHKRVVEALEHGRKLTEVGSNTGEST